MKSKYAGYMGKVMLVDLTTETISEYPWSDRERELYVGGKIMAARILADHLTGKDGDIFDYITGKRTGTTALPIICITTTAGTGSEGNATAVFTNDETLDKKGLVNPLIYPKVSFIDSDFKAFETKLS